MLDKYERLETQLKQVKNSQANAVQPTQSVIEQELKSTFHEALNQML